MRLGFFRAVIHEWCSVTGGINDNGGVNHPVTNNR